MVDRSSRSTATPPRQRRGRLAAAVAGLAAVALLASGCQLTVHGAGSATAAEANPTNSGATATETPTPTPTPTPAKVTTTPANKAKNVLPTDPITATASLGALDSVALTSSAGDKVAGKIGSDGTWKAGSRLRPSTSYTMTVKATGPDGTPTTVTSKFSTLKPAVTATYSLIANGATVGVGMPIIVAFDSPVATKAQRAAVEKAVTLTATPKQTGSWGWLDTRQLTYRPKSFWKPGTKITVSAPLTGLQTGTGKWVANDASGTWYVGSSMVSTVNIKTHKMTVTRNGSVVKVIPVSTGKPGPKTETRSGTKVIIERLSEITMDSATVGIKKGEPGYYKIDTKWNMRVTWTGEFLHSAPWSVGAQGSANVSHGCTNMSPANAEWMFNNSKVGDVVRFVGSSRVFQPTEGYGMWQFSWSGWQGQSALA